jgi:hypothetical protein
MGYHEDEDCECTEFDHMAERRLQEIMSEYMTLELQAMAGRIWQRNPMEDTGERIGAYLASEGVVDQITRNVDVYRHAIGCSPKQAIDEVVRNLEVELTDNKEIWA